MICVLKQIFLLAGLPPAFPHSGFPSFLPSRLPAFPRSHFGCGHAALGGFVSRGKRNRGSSLKASPVGHAAARPDRIAKIGEATHGRFRNLWLGALHLAVTLVAYGPALNGGLLWDDDQHITRPELQSAHGLARIWSEVGATLQFYPLLHSAFWVEHKIWGDATLGYHLLNVLLHALAAMLVVVILRRLAIPGAYLAGAIFALHPLQVESVAWISEQKNLLSAVFYLCAMMVYLRFDRTRRVRFYLGALGLFVLALLSKTVTATLPGALLVIFWWQRGRLSWRRDVAPLVPMFLLGAGAGLITSWWELNLNLCVGSDFQFTWIQRILIAGRTLWFLLGKLCWPADLIFSYPRWRIDPAAAWQYLFPLGALAVTAVLWAISHRTRAPLAAALFFGGTLFPVLGFFNLYTFRYSFVADHYQYLACLGIITLVSGGIAALLARARPSGRRIAHLLCLALLVTLAGLTWRQCGMYRNAETLYRETLARNPDCWMAHNNLGMALDEANRIPEAFEHYRQALRIKPESVEVLNNIGQDLVKMNRRSEAIESFRNAIRIKPDYADAHINLGITLYLEDRAPEAIGHFQEALHIKPDSAQALYNLGLALEKTNRLPEAIERFQQAVRIDPDYVDAQNNLGVALAYAGRIAEAIGHYQQALRIKPDYVQALDNLGLALWNTNRLSEAVERFQQAVRINPDFADARCHLGIALIQEHRLTEAQEQFEQALRIKPDYEEARAGLQDVRKALGFAP